MRSGQQLGLCFVQQDLLMQGRAFGRALQGGGLGAALLWGWRKSSGEKQRDQRALWRGKQETHLGGQLCPRSSPFPQDTGLIQHKSWHYLLVSESPNMAADLVY